MLTGEASQIPVKLARQVPARFGCQAGRPKVELLSLEVSFFLEVFQSFGSFPPPLFEPLEPLVTTRL